MGKGYGLLGRSLNLEMKNLEYGLMGYGMKSLEGSWVGNLIEKKKATLWEKVMEYTCIWRILKIWIWNI